MMETFLNSSFESFGWSEHLPAIQGFKKLISSGVQAAYLIFSRAVRGSKEEKEFQRVQRSFKR
jgi:hypothetical protein